jgi:transposase
MVAGLDEARAQGLKLFFLDETVFSFATFPTRTWYSKHSNVCIPEKTYRFKTQAVVAAVSHEGGVEELLCADGAIATKDFVFFLELLKRKNEGRPYALFLDNLKVHTSKDSTKAMQALGVVPIFNVPYSPQFNGIEAVFSIVKCNFKKELLR